MEGSNTNNENYQLSTNNSQFLIYQTESGETKLDVRFQDETVWLTQKLMAELFQTTSQNITIHLKNIFEEGELEEKATCKDFLQVQKEGAREVKRKQKFYNLDAIISVGYRIKSHVATKFRQWATQHIKEYIVKGQAMRRIPMYMKDWIEKLNGFLTLNDREILNNAGTISYELAKENAEREYKKFKDTQRKMIAESDFEKVIKKIEAKKKK